jgi:hypothetical protein
MVCLLVELDYKFLYAMFILVRKCGGNMDDGILDANRVTIRAPLRSACAMSGGTR